MTAGPQWCGWHKAMATGTVVVGWAEGNSGPGQPIYACRPCRVERGLIPFADHPRDTDGRPRYEPRDRT